MWGKLGMGVTTLVGSCSILGILIAGEFNLSAYCFTLEVWFVHMIGLLDCILPYPDF